MRHYRIGLTGGIASGKSIVAGMFAALGVPVIDTDDIARAVVTPGEPALEEIVAAFGREFLDDQGRLDRRRLRAHVFADDGARRRLETILHPRIEAATLAACDRAGGPYQIVVVPLLLESGFAKHVDRVLVVNCPEELQRARLVARDAASPEDVQRMLAAQLDRPSRLAQADDVIDNSGSLAETRAQVKELHGRYLQLTQRGRKSGSDT